MKKLFVALAAVTLWMSLAHPAFARGKRNQNKPYKAARKGNFNVQHAKIYKHRKGMKRMPANHVSPKRAAHPPRD